MMGKQWVFMVVLFLLVVSIFYVVLFVKGSSEGVEAKMISKTEYVPGDAGQVIVQMKSALSHQAIVATCFASIQYPDKSDFVVAHSMGATGEGTYYYNFTVPSIEGVYEYQTVCDYNGVNYTAAKAFHVSSGHREVVEAINKRINIVPQGVSEVEFGKTAAESWYFNTPDWFGINSTFCSLYHIVGNTKERVTGVLANYDFSTGIPVEFNVTNGSTSSYQKVYDSQSTAWEGKSPGTVVESAGKIHINTVYTGAEGHIVYPISLGDDFILSFKVGLLSGVGGASTFHMALLGADRDNGSKVFATGYTNLFGNVLISFGINDQILAGSQGWFGYNTAYPAGNGNVFILRNTTQNGTKWARLNYTWPVNVPSSEEEVVIVRRGSMFQLFIGGVEQYSWSDDVGEIRSIYFGGPVPSSYDTILDDVEIKVATDEDYEVSGKTFTYYWYADKDLFERGENYMVDCDVVVSQQDGLVSLYDLMQYVFVNRNKNIHAVAVK